MSALSLAVAFVLVLPLRLYRLLLSPLLPRVCRFHPSCSVYAMGALSVHGPLKGLWLSARRLTRCHPFNPGGLDPVPGRDGVAAAELLRARAPWIATQLAAPPPPEVLALVPPEKVSPWTNKSAS